MSDNEEHILDKAKEEQFVKELKGLLAGDGSAFDRMNAGQGGEGLPKWFLDLAENLRKQGVTDENFDEWYAKNRGKKLG